MEPVNNRALLESLLLGKLPQTVKGSSLPRIKEGAFPTNLQVSWDGYPNDDRVEEITLVAATRCREWLHDVLPEVWKIGYRGKVHIEDSEHSRDVYVSTGGWSGCESVIDAILRNFFMRYYLTTSTTGGGYIFTVPHTDSQA